MEKNEGLEAAESMEAVHSGGAGTAAGNGRRGLIRLCSECKDQ